MENTLVQWTTTTRDKQKVEARRSEPGGAPNPVEANLRPEGDKKTDALAAGTGLMQWSGDLTRRLAWAALKGLEADG